MQPDNLENYVRQQAGKLERYYRGITSCRVIVERQGRHKHGNLFHVRIDLGVPDGELVVKHSPTIHATLKSKEAVKAVKSAEVARASRIPHRAVLDAFSEMRRRLQDYVRTRRGKVKTPAEPLAVATVAALFPEEQYGFLSTPDGREVYFHADSVVDGHFNRLRIGSPVRFAEEMGEKGPQASTVHLVHPRKQAKKASTVVAVKKRAPVQQS
jgi:cold shock CspA family protein